MEYVLIGLIIVVVIYLVTKKGKGHDINITAPEKLRTNLCFGYYGSKDFYGDEEKQLPPSRQVEETADHTNLHWEAFWDGEERAINNIENAIGAVVVDLDSYLFERTDKKTVIPRSDGESRVRTLFNKLRDAGILHKVTVLVPQDEPNLPETATCDYLPSIVETIRSIASDYSELRNVKVGCVYTTVRPMCHLELFDIVGFDDYDKKSSIFSVGGSYDQMKSMLRPDQRTWTLPGGTYGQNPVPFINHAHNNPEVFAVIPFIWRVPHDNKFNGICELPIREEYVKAGKSVKELSSS